MATEVIPLQAGTAGAPVNTPAGQANGGKQSENRLAV
jgi:hypothetical protein